MPNYKYVCNACGVDWEEAFPISFDPKKTIPCRFRNCDGRGERKIIGGNNFTMGKQTLGKWYKNETGKELLG